MEANLDELAPIGPLTDWLDAHVPELGKGPLKREMLHGGTSNIVFTLDRGGLPMVLRRPPAVPPPGAEKGVLREARVLTALRGRGLRLGLATNDAEAPARAHLAAHGVAHLFDSISGFDSGHGAKPGPGMLLAFAAHCGLAPARVVMVGDSRHDLMAGRAAGMRTVAVLTGIAGADQLAPLADAVLPDIAALGGWIDSLAA